MAEGVQVSDTWLLDKDVAKLPLALHAELSTPNAVPVTVPPVLATTVQVCGVLQKLLPDVGAVAVPTNDGTSFAPASRESEPPL